MRAEETCMKTVNSPGRIGQEKPAPPARLRLEPAGIGVAA
jgi:hypothetical protein